MMARASRSWQRCTSMYGSFAFGSTSGGVAEMDCRRTGNYSKHPHGTGLHWADKPTQVARLHKKFVQAPTHDLHATAFASAHQFDDQLTWMKAVRSSRTSLWKGVEPDCRSVSTPLTESKPITSPFMSCAVMGVLASSWDDTQSRLGDR